LAGDTIAGAGIIGVGTTGVGIMDGTVDTVGVTLLGEQGGIAGHTITVDITLYKIHPQKAETWLEGQEQTEEELWYPIMEVEPHVR
jgi:hypothetical protein